MVESSWKYSLFWKRAVEFTIFNVFTRILGWIEYMEIQKRKKDSNIWLQTDLFFLYFWKNKQITKWQNAGKSTQCPINAIKKKGSI